MPSAPSRPPLGRRYNRAKKAQNDGGAGTAKATGGNSYHRLQKTAEVLATQHGISEKTVRNAGQFADAIERVKALAPGIEREVATGNTRAVLVVQVIAATVPRDVWRARISQRAL